MISNIQYRLSLTLRGPLLSNAVGTMAMGMDNVMQRYHGQPVINGSQIRGNVRHALQHFVTTLKDDQSKNEIDNQTHKDKIEELNHCLTDWFGSDSRADLKGTLANKRAKLNFDAFWKPQEQLPEQGEARTRIRIDAHTGTASTGSLQVVEQICPTGDSLTFSGIIRYQISTQHAELEKFEHWISKALHTLTAIGAQKNVGYGRIVDWQLQRIEAISQAGLYQDASDGPQPTETDPSQGSRMGITLSLDRPMCIAKQTRKGNNRFISDDVIPGTMLLAVIAEQLSDEEKKALEFDNWQISHAQPVRRGSLTRGMPLPLSLARMGNQWHDTALQNSPFLLKNGGSLEVPLFQPDWKDDDYAAAMQVYQPIIPRPTRYLRVHTAINSDGVAADEQLFSLECVDPHGFQWCADVELGRIQKDDIRKRAQQKLRKIFSNELVGIGKTKACAKVHIHTEAHTQHSPVKAIEGDKQKYIVTLVTPACLLDDEVTLPGTGGHAQLKDAYGTYFTHASEGRLSLSHFFAKQKLTGGDYYWHKNIKNDSKQRQYRPVWLTNEGSVFVLTANDDATQEELQIIFNQWQTKGLVSSESRDKLGWQHDPYLPQNGYGEVVINHPSQVALTTIDPTKVEVLS